MLKGEIPLSTLLIRGKMTQKREVTPMLYVALF